MRVNTWHQAIAQCEKQGLAYVLITVLQSAGSTPRNAGSKMLITGDSQYDTIGGGHLEYQAIAKGRQLLAKGESYQEVESFPLSSKLGQCCGGAVKILYEVLACHQQHLAIFGAGHVAQALVPILGQLPLQISWIDSREDIFGKGVESAKGDNKSSSQDFSDKAREIAASFANVEAISDDAPIDIIASLPMSSWVIILTHNHQLDYELIEAALKHDSLSYIGMIGSATKAKRFQTKLSHRGFSSEQLARVTSPIGELSITGKRPIEVAVSISAQVINILNKKSMTENKQPLLATEAIELSQKENQ